MMNNRLPISDEKRAAKSPKSGKALITVTSVGLAFLVGAAPLLIQSTDAAPQAGQFQVKASDDSGHVATAGSISAASPADPETPTAPQEDLKYASSFSSEWNFMVRFEPERGGDGRPTDAALAGIGKNVNGFSEISLTAYKKLGDSQWREPEDSDWKEIGRKDGMSANIQESNGYIQVLGSKMDYDFEFETEYKLVLEFKGGALDGKSFERIVPVPKLSELQPESWNSGTGKVNYISHQINVTLTSSDMSKFESAPISGTYTQE